MAPRMSLRDASIKPKKKICRAKFRAVGYPRIDTWERSREVDQLVSFGESLSSWRFPRTSIYLPSRGAYGRVTRILMMPFGRFIPRRNAYTWHVTVWRYFLRDPLIDVDMRLVIPWDLRYTEFDVEVPASGVVRFDGGSGIVDKQWDPWVCD